MRAVWSFWSRPYQGHYGSNWTSDRHHLLAWVLSVETARQHYPDTWLVTDDEGARLLVDGLGLRFNQVSTDLNRLSACDPAWWSLGKLAAYSLQTAPFVHIDDDVFLWKRLPERLERASILAQNPEPFSSFAIYRPDRMVRALNYPAQGWLPPEWSWYRVPGPKWGLNCGIFGGCAVDLIRQYAQAGLRIIEDPANRSGLARLVSKGLDMVVVEQYLSAAFGAVQPARSGRSRRGVQVEFLFRSMGECWKTASAVEAGYTHLLGGRKKNPEVARVLERRVRQDYPDLYERCQRMKLD